MPKITPFLWYDNQAEHAMNFYTSIFKDSRAGSKRMTLLWRSDVVRLRRKFYIEMIQ